MSGRYEEQMSRARKNHGDMMRSLYERIDRFAGRNDPVNSSKCGSSVFKNWDYLEDFKSVFGQEDYRMNFGLILRDHLGKAWIMRDAASGRGKDYTRVDPIPGRKD
jgi:hypothetical protein